MRFEVDVDAYDPKEEHFLSAVQGICIRPNSAGRKNCMNGGTLKCRLYVDETSHWRFMRTFIFHYNHSSTDGWGTAMSKTCD
jgi:hypothetical protein